MSPTDAVMYDQAQALDQQCREEAEAVHQEGKKDGAAGHKPRYADPVYLEGYIAGVKQLPVEKETGLIDYGAKFRAWGGLMYVDGYSQAIHSHYPEPF
jgi:hypothetical protein